MSLEIERKFLVKNDSWKKDVYSSTRLCQKYVPLAPIVPGIVRLRIAGEKAFLTLKTPQKNCSRGEFEYEIPVADAEAIMQQICPGAAVEKVRHLVDFGGFRWEIDEFTGFHAGLVLAEIELPSADTVFEKPDWLGQEVSGDFRYCNSNLAKMAGFAKK